ncbi:hypothetical protein PsYK624_033380 [Phanerochaete sordida]|uniref:Uncharacterized protein n=1 Tax=Phanerochaete sordida TaxID=48140 RepID=A0A9P3G439_9APHY|nr:hypothetical protein PsYK624_033380 [Phanerochaete sordida]
MHASTQSDAPFLLTILAAETYISFFTHFTLFPLMGIVSVYPTAVVLLVELTGSTYNRALRLESMPTPVMQPSPRRKHPRSSSFESDAIDDDDASTASAGSDCPQNLAEGTMQPAQEMTLVSGIRYMPAAHLQSSESGALRSAYYTEGTAH